MNKIRLGVNIDHVATLRNVRGGVHPCPVRAAQIALEAGADGITAHLREDRRHIRDGDMIRLKNEVNLPLNFEMAATEEMQHIALEVKPNAVCLVPEKREELTTEGGLDVAGQIGQLKSYISPFRNAGIRVSLFIDPSVEQIDAAAETGTDIVELHTGTYAERNSSAEELERLQQAAAYAHKAGLETHAGHGLTFDNVKAVAALPEVVELNIGHFIIGEAVFCGLSETIARMRRLIEEART